MTQPLDRSSDTHSAGVQELSEQGVGYRKGQCAERNYALGEARLTDVLSQWWKTCAWVSPYSRGVRTDHLMALAGLGLNEAHFLGAVKRRLREIMGEGDWAWFDGREVKGKKRDTTDGRIVQNFRSFRRLCVNGGQAAYGKKLSQLGCCVDIFYIETGPKVSRRGHPDIYLRLNTHSVEPLLLHLSSVSEIPEVDRSRPSLGPSTAG